VISGKSATIPEDAAYDKSVDVRNMGLVGLHLFDHVKMLPWKQMSDDVFVHQFKPLLEGLKSQDLQIRSWVITLLEDMLEKDPGKRVNARASEGRVPYLQERYGDQNLNKRQR
jgi:hypothetical protein